LLNEVKAATAAPGAGPAVAPAAAPYPKAAGAAPAPAAAQPAVPKDVRDRKFYLPWVQKNLGLTANCKLNRDFADIEFFQVQPDAVNDGTYAHKEWVAFQEDLAKHVREGAKSSEFKGLDFDKQVSFVKRPINQLADHLAKNAGDPKGKYIIIASCPGNKMDEAEKVLMDFKDKYETREKYALMGWSQKEGYGQ